MVKRATWPRAGEGGAGDAGEREKAAQEKGRRGDTDAGELGSGAGVRESGAGERELGIWGESAVRGRGISRVSERGAKWETTQFA